MVPLVIHKGHCFEMDEIIGFCQFTPCSQLKTQDQVNDGQFHKLLDYHSNYQGVIELIFSVFLIQIDENCIFCHMLIVISAERLLDHSLLILY